MSSPLLAQPCTASSPPCLITGQSDNARDAYNPYETILTSPNLSGGTSLTELAPLLVDTPAPSYGPSNPIYAQPLYVAGITLNSKAPAQSLENCSNLTVAGKPGCNMLLVGTLYDSLWAFNADTGQTIFSRTGMWSDCGTGGGVAVHGTGGLGSLNFGGIVATPVVDVTLSPPAMFLTDLCVDSQSRPHWFLHEVDITNQLQDVPGSGSPVEIAGSSGTYTFSAGNDLQRLGLLEVQNPGGTPANVIYIGFGSAVPEAGNTTTGKSYPYHGWLFGYSTTGPNNQLVQDFVYNSTGATDSSSTSCNTNAPLCGSKCKAGQYENQPNWCGHGGGIWMSGRGPAASSINGVSRAFVGIGNGGFQSGAANAGESIVGFTSSTTGVNGTPSDSFTPQGGPLNPFTPGMLAKADCPAEKGGASAPCPYTFDYLNENDMDMSVGGMLLFEGANQDNWLLTADKSGAGYLLNQESLGGFTQNDTGNQFPFLAAASPCWNLNVRSDDCHRVTSFSTYPSASGTRYFYYWPYHEPLNSVQFSNNAPVSGIGKIVTAGSAPPYTKISLRTTCTLNSASAPCLNNQLVAGSTLTAGSQSQTVVSVTQTALTVTPGFSAPLSTDKWTYKGYLVSPQYATIPADATTVDYPGGQLEVTSNNGSGGVVWGLITEQTAPADPPVQPCATLTAMLNAYDAVTLQQIWSSYNTSTDSGPCDGPCFTIMPPPGSSCQPTASTFGLPVIVNGAVYIPTYQINGSQADANCTASAPCSGLIVYCGTGATACGGQWQRAAKR